MSLNWEEIERRREFNQDLGFGPSFSSAGRGWSLHLEEKPPRRCFSEEAVEVNPGKLLAWERAKAQRLRFFAHTAEIGMTLWVADLLLAAAATRSLLISQRASRR